METLILSNMSALHHFYREAPLLLPLGFMDGSLEPCPDGHLVDLRTASHSRRHASRVHAPRGLNQCSPSKDLCLDAVICCLSMLLCVLRAPFLQPLLLSLLMAVADSFPKRPLSLCLYVLCILAEVPKKKILRLGFAYR